MEENYQLEKEYTIPLEIFREAYIQFQKKYVFPKKRILIAVLCVIGVISAVMGFSSENGQYAFFLFSFVMFAFAVKTWYDPRKLRRNLVESVSALGEPVYKIGVSESFIDISTVADDMSNVEDTEDMEDDPLPEKTRISFADGLKTEEYDKFFLIIPDNASLYILPKEKFTEKELEILRAIPINVQGGKNAI